MRKPNFIPPNINISMFAERPVGRGTTFSRLSQVKLCARQTALQDEWILTRKLRIMAVSYHIYACSSLTTFQALNWWSSGPFHLQIGVGKLSCLIKSLVVEQDSFSRKGFNCLRKGVPDIALMSKPFHLSLYVFRSISLAVRSTANLRIL